MWYKRFFYFVFNVILQHNGIAYMMPVAQINVWPHTSNKYFVILDCVIIDRLFSSSIFSLQWTRFLGFIIEGVGEILWEEKGFSFYFVCPHSCHCLTNSRREGTFMHARTQSTQSPVTTQQETRAVFPCFPGFYKLALAQAVQQASVFKPVLNTVVVRGEYVLVCSSLGTFP